MSRPAWCLLFVGAVGCSAASADGERHATPGRPATSAVGAATSDALSSSGAPSSSSCPDAPPCTDRCEAGPKALSVGDAHACALAVSGELSCWGDDASGQLGDGGREPRARPVKVASGIDAVAAGDGFTCVLEKGTARCWGGLGRLDLGPTDAEIEESCNGRGSDPECRVVAATKKLRAAMGPVGRKLADDERAAAAKEAVTPRALAPAITDAVSIAAGGDMVCTLDRSGQATCFMYALPGSAPHSIYGKARQAAPAQVKGATDLVEVAPSRLRSCGRTKSGKVLCWAFGEDATEVEGVSHATSVATAQERACASIAGNGVMCWSLRSKGAPTKVDGAEHAIEVRGGGTDSFCARTSQNDVVCWGRFGGDGSESTVGTSPELAAATRIEGAAGASSLAVGSGSACASASDGLRCWGATRRGALGDGSFASEVLAPVKVALEARAVDVSAANFTTCAALEDGRVRCWGYGYGAPDRSPAEGPASRWVEGVAGAEHVAVGGISACAISKGALSCWGRGDPSPAMPIAGLTDVIAVAPGVGVSCAARANGETDCFYGAGTAAALPRVRDLVELSYGASDWSCGRKKSGDMVCWSMPIEMPSGKLSPPKVFAIAGTAKSSSVATSAFRACVARADGSLACTSSTSKKHELRAAKGFADVTQVSVANASSTGALLCARTRAGAVQCQGDGRSGELGTGVFTPPRYPGVATVKGIDDAKRVTAGAQHACALRADGSVWCWGGDAVGSVTGQAAGARMCAKPIAHP